MRHLVRIALCGLLIGWADRDANATRDRRDPVQQRGRNGRKARPGFHSSTLQHKHHRRHPDGDRSESRPLARLLDALAVAPEQVEEVVAAAGRVFDLQGVSVWGKDAGASVPGKGPRGFVRGVSAWVEGLGGPVQQEERRGFACFAQSRPLAHENPAIRTLIQAAFVAGWRGKAVPDAVWLDPDWGVSQEVALDIGGSMIDGYLQGTNVSLLGTFETDWVLENPLYQDVVSGYHLGLGIQAVRTYERMPGPMRTFDGIIPRLWEKLQILQQSSGARDTSHAVDAGKKAALAGMPLLELGRTVLEGQIRRRY
jgi:hypothetical protein